jgi:hypothetical protein
MQPRFGKLRRNTADKDGSQITWTHHYLNTQRSINRAIPFILKDDLNREAVIQTIKDGAKGLGLAQDDLDHFIATTDIGVLITFTVKRHYEDDDQPAKIGALANGISAYGTVAPWPNNAADPTSPSLPEDYSMLTHPIIIPFTAGHEQLTNLSFATKTAKKGKVMYFMSSLTNAQLGLKIAPPIPSTILEHFIAHHDMEKEAKFYTVTPLKGVTDTLELAKKLEAKYVLFAIWRPDELAKTFTMILTGNINEAITTALAKKPVLMATNLLMASVRAFDIPAALAKKVNQSNKKAKAANKEETLDDLFKRELAE